MILEKLHKKMESDTFNTVQMSDISYIYHTYIIHICIHNYRIMG